RALGNMASMLGDLGELERSGAMFSEALALGEELGFGQPITWLRGEVAHVRFYTGDWEEARATFDDLLAIWARNPFWMEPIVRGTRARLLAAVDPAGVGNQLDAVVRAPGAPATRRWSAPRSAWPRGSTRIWATPAACRLRSRCSRRLPSRRAGACRCTG